MEAAANRAGVKIRMLNQKIPAETGYLLRMPSPDLKNKQQKTNARLAR
jgi:hypothetical protein